MRDREALQEWMRAGCPVEAPLDLARVGVRATYLGDHATALVVAVGDTALGPRQGQPRLFVYCAKCGHDSLSEVGGVESCRFPDLMDAIGAAVFRLHRDPDAVPAVAEDVPAPGVTRSARRAVSDLLANGLRSVDGDRDGQGHVHLGATATDSGLVVAVYYTPVSGEWGRSLVDRAVMETGP